MDKLTQFFAELLNSTEQMARFNEGSSQQNITKNRRAMLSAANVECDEAIMMMSTKELQDLMELKLQSHKEETICKQLENQTLNDPDRLAIIDGEKKITYGCLMNRANRITWQLENRGVAAGSFVGVCMNRSWELVAALIGVMRAGCAYVPLDPAYPKDRIQYMLEHSCATAAIVDGENTANLCKGVSELVWINRIDEQTYKHEHECRKSVTKASVNDLAYVIYTSGSTGQPKGVAVEHKSLVAMCQSMRALLNDDELNGVLAAASVCFDPSVMEIMGTLSLGGTVILAKNVLELPKLLSKDRVRTCIMVPSAMQALLSTERLPQGILCLVFGGEVLKPSLVEQIHAINSCTRVINVYGPTEDTVYSTVKEIEPGAQEITIGKSVPNSRSYILDVDMQPVSTGEAGELYLAGNKLARGYLFDEALTNERFIKVETSALISDQRLYKTGDLCRWTEGGEIEFLGRVDQQVKIRGFRIELEEIESILELMPGVNAAAAAAVDGGIGQKILLVYVVSQNESLTDNSIKAFLAERLPKYMVPQIVKRLNELPLLPNGKLDRKQLVDFEERSCSKSKLDESSAEGDRNTDIMNCEYDLNGLKINKNIKINQNLKSNKNIKISSNLIQRLLGSKKGQQAAILSIIQSEVASILNISEPDNICTDESFDSLGVDSLSTVELEHRLNNTLGRMLPSMAIYEHPTPNALANYIIDLMGDGADDINNKNCNSISNNNDNSVTQKTMSGEVSNVKTDPLAQFQSHIQSGHPTFQVAKAASWSVTDKSLLVQEMMRMVNNERRNPYSKVLSTGSGARGIVTDAHNDEEQEAIIWTTNLYLGLNRDEEVIKAATSALACFGTGMGTSAAASGLTDLHLEFENEFAELVGKPAACLFPTGYTANVGLIAGLLGKDDVVIIDQLCHASIIDGARLCGATVRTFQHNNAADLKSVLESEVSPYRTALVVLEGVYSMGEGAAPVAEIVRMAKKYDALVLVDEAHSFGFYGESGAGICAAQGITDQVDFIMTTLSKSLGSLGGVIAAKKEHVDLLKSSARAYIFQASVSPADIAAALTALRRIRSDDSLREKLWETTRYMRQQFEDAGYDLGTGDGPIVTPHFGDKDKLFAIVQALYKRGIQTSAVTYPIVESGRGRLRLICSAAHTQADVNKTLEALIEAEREVDSLQVPVKNEPMDTKLAVSEVEEWAKIYSNYLAEWLVENSGPTPNLTLSVRVCEQIEPTTILFNDGNIRINAQKITGLPSCSLFLKNKKAVSALRSFDVQSLLQSICNGNCLLSGQIEPFIWFIGRMVEQQRDSSCTNIQENIKVESLVN